MKRAAAVHALPLLLALACSTAPAGPRLPGPTPEQVAGEIQIRLETLWSSGGLRVARRGVAAVELLPALYAGVRFRQLWTDRRAALELLQVVRESESDGLYSRDYHRTELEQRLSGVDGPTRASEAAELDILLTDALIRLAYHLYFGKVDPERLHPNWNFTKAFDGIDPEQVIRSAIAEGAIASQLERLRPTSPFYPGLRAALAEYRGIAASGGWESVPEGPVLEPGSEGPRVLALRRRLAASADLDRSHVDSPHFDAELEAAVRRFQSRHRLASDARVGRRTLDALNVPVGERIEQIRLNLERARWVPRGVSGEFVVIDIAGFEALYHDAGRVPWRSRIQVGRVYRRTPVFQARIEYLVLNPTWTVPPGILRKDVLPSVRRDIGYLQANRLRVLDPHGRELDPAGIDWSREPFPFQIRQDPGAGNALGRVKFVFPNRHYVFLHDTPNRALFERERRTFSSGCIRLENALELATLLLKDSRGWSRSALDAAVASGETRTLFLPRPVPIFVVYWTVAVDPGGVVQFRQDPYERDPELAGALREKFPLPRS